MKKVRTQAQTLAEGYVPETQVADQIGISFGQAVLAARSYGLTAEPAYLDEFQRPSPTSMQRSKQRKRWRMPIPN